MTLLIDTLYQPFYQPTLITPSQLTLSTHPPSQLTLTTCPTSVIHPLNAPSLFTLPLWSVVHRPTSCIGMPSSVGVLGAQPHRSLSSMSSGNPSPHPSQYQPTFSHNRTLTTMHSLIGGGKGQGGGFNGMGGAKMALSGRQMMLVKEESHASNHSGTHGGQGLGPGFAPGQGLGPMGESQEYVGGGMAHQEGVHTGHHPHHPQQEGPAIGQAFSSSRGNSPTHNHPSQPLRGQPTHPRFQGTKRDTLPLSPLPPPFLLFLIIYPSHPPSL